MKRYIKAAMLLLILSVPVVVYGQDFDDDQDVPDTVPLDGGLSLLAAGGIAYGAKKWHELKRSKNK
jgi:hypothetical protein